jgi:hypothetical protein
MSQLKTFHRRVDAPGMFSQAVFKLTTAANKEVFMRVKRNNGLNDQRTVVEVEAQHFLRLWFPSRIGATAEVWSTDRKFAEAIAGFAHGEPNPVPIPRVSCKEYMARHPVYGPRWLLLYGQTGWKETRTVQVTVCDLTRTIWLYANGVRSFPVECENPAQAALLTQHAGIGTPALTLDELIPDVPAPEQIW